MPTTSRTPPVRTSPAQRAGSRTSDPPALRRLVALDPSPSSARRGRCRRTGRCGQRRFGHQPGLDGLRALSVIAVILYHGGFPWIHGGWVGVEVFFVVSGFLITSLLLDERERDGRTDLGAFWVRRARRLLPALAVMLVVVAAVTLAVGSAAQRGELRRDLPWAIGYLGNWGQIVGDVPYYAADPPLLRHLWSLAIEEQFYLVWPLAFVALVARRVEPPGDRPPARRACRRRDGVGLLAARRRAGTRRRVRRRRPRQLHVPVDVHPGRRAAARRGGRVRVATVAVRRRRAIAPRIGRRRAGARRRRRRGHRRPRLHRRRRPC